MLFLIGTDLSIQTHTRQLRRSHSLSDQLPGFITAAHSYSNFIILSDSDIFESTMGGRGSGKKYAVKFLVEWLDKSIDGVRNSVWLVRSDQARNQAKCKICTNSEGQFKTFSVGEGYTAVTTFKLRNIKLT